MGINKTSILIFAGLLISIRVHAQDKRYIPIGHTKYKDTILVTHPDTTFEKDIFDIIGSIFGESKKPGKVDSVTSKPVISIIPAIGYTLQTGLAGTISGNVIFRLAPDTRISTITVNPAYTQNKQVIVPIQSNIWSKNNKYDFIGDFRFYKYPQSSFGLGSNSDRDNENPLVYSFFRFHETVLRNITGNFYAGLGYIFDDRWNMYEKGQLNGKTSDYERYGPVSHAISTGVTFQRAL
ncbi:hypothetical protein ACFJIV_19765 [Mucilaginibacter sp. UC70_90]